MTTTQHTLQLIKAPIDSSEALVDKWHMPQDLLSVAAAAQEEGVDVEILDGNMMPLEEILQKINERSTIIGLSFTIMSLKSAEIILRHAKQTGAFVICGGQASSGNANVIAQHKYVDAVVAGDGEPAIKALLRLAKFSIDNLSTVPNLVYEYKGQIHRTQTAQIDMSNVKYIARDIGGLNPESYILQYPVSNTMKNIECHRPTNIYSRRGCPRACSFCARIDKVAWRTREPMEVIREIKTLIELYDIDYFLDTADTWIQNRWVQEYRECVLRELSDYDFRMHIFADVRDINEASVQLLKDVRVDQCLLGIESGSPNVLKMNGKYYTQERILRAVDLLCSKGIGVYASFVVGLIGEDEDSLQETRYIIDKLRIYPGVRCYVNVIIPLPGSPLWSSFEQYYPSNNNPFEYNLFEARTQFLKLHTSTDLNTLNEFRNEVLSVNNLPILEYAR